MVTRRTKRKPAESLKKHGQAVHFLHPVSCPTCRTARSFLERRGFPLYFRDRAQERFSSTERVKFVGGRDHADVRNPRNGVSRDTNRKDEPPPRREAIRLRATIPNLIRRPLLVAGKGIEWGLDRKGISRLSSEQES